MKCLIVIIWIMVNVNRLLGQDLGLIHNKIDTINASKIYNISLPKFNNKSKDSIYYMTFKILNMSPGDSVNVKLIDNNEGSANITKEYSYENRVPNDSIFHDNSFNLFSVGFRVITTAENRYADLNVILTKDDLSTKYKIRLNFNTSKPKSNAQVSEPDTSKWTLKMVTGSNFDFFDSPSFKNFAGDIKLFAPNIWNIRKKSDTIKAFNFIGLQFGLFNFRYFDTDSSMSNIQNERYLLNATEKIRPDTTKSVRSLYSSNTKTDYNLWGMNADLLFNLSDNNKNEWAQIYFAPHFEAIIRTQITSGRQISIRKDTLIVTKADYSTQGFVIGAFPAIHPAYQKRTFYDYYFGFGIPIRLNIKKAFVFDFHPIVGQAYYQVPSAVNSTRVGSNYVPYQRNKKMFFLGKIQLITTLAPVDIALGGEFRSIVNEDHYFALYIGAAITLDKLKR